MVAELIACIVAFTGLAHPEGLLPNVVHDPARLEAAGIWGKYSPNFFPTVRVRYDGTGHWATVILAHELTHHVQHGAGAPYDEEQAWQAGYACAASTSS